MASATKQFKQKKKRKTRTAGRGRKSALQAQGTTPTKEVFFGDSTQN